MLSSTISMQLTGHSVAQTPQPLQICMSVPTFLASLTRTALSGQTIQQVMQWMHFS